MLSSNIDRVIEFMKLRVAQIADPEHQPRLFAAQVKMARYLVWLEEERDESIKDSELQ